jgi:NitT/TauT family transport system substrate-binding protein
MRPAVRLVQALPTRDFGYLPLYVSQGKGYFAEEGLDVEIPVMTATTAIPALLNKEVQVGPGGNAVRAAYQGAPLRAVFYQYNRMTLLGVGSSEIKSYADLGGKALATSTANGSDELAMKLILSRTGIPLSDVQLVRLGPPAQRAQAMLAGQVQFTALNADAAVDMERQGLNIVGHFGDLIPIPFSGLAVHEDTLRERRDLLKAWMRASIRGVQLVKRQPAEAAEIAVRELGLDPAVARRALELLGPALDEDDPGGFSEAGLLQNIQFDIETIGLADDPRDLARQTHDISLLRETQRELGIRCKGGYQCE